jgi:osmotically-inducible protein OsmY
MIERSELEGILKDTLSLSGCRINVLVSKSKITLTGLVNTPEQKVEAERIAWKVVGVWTVGNELRVVT